MGGRLGSLKSLVEISNFRDELASLLDKRLLNGAVGKIRRADGLGKRHPSFHGLG